MESSNPIIPTIRKVEQFEDFIKLLERGARAHWVDVAEIIGVNQDTVTAWKQHPLAREARLKGIERCLNEMERVGYKDWRMWEAKLKLLGIQAPQLLDVKADVNTESIVIYKPTKVPEGSKNWEK